MNVISPRDVSTLSIKGEPERGGDKRRWYAVLTQPRRELRAQTQLQNQHYHVYMPKRRKTVRHARKLKNVLAPFFPRYLFITLDPTIDQWRNVNSTFGVCSLVMAGERPHPVPHGVIEAMIAATDSAGLLSFAQDFKIGERVRLLAGPFAERLGTLDRLDDNGRVRVLIEIMGGPVPVQLPRGHIIAA